MLPAAGEEATPTVFTRVPVPSAVPISTRMTPVMSAMTSGFLNTTFATAQVQARILFVLGEAAQRPVQDQRVWNLIRVEGQQELPIGLEQRVVEVPGLGVSRLVGQEEPSSQESLLTTTTVTSSTALTATARRSAS